ncbi:hypothetical protein B5M43_001110 [Microbacterium sp. MEC084]|jgi:hypothetical protein|uniref:hypothetical protein n=1 Tax=unclassified Microbacterium TaxID=2609290 RepID=UPI0006FAA29A|nr:MULTISPECIES: hypothetical protein [unclassified Microbacterium]KQZ04844.1 hypothetical protein ASD19_02125 [Microbacterium sp. Root53]MCD1267454.1 hypothetical protein [Microbacterium sp. MEC084]
MIGLDPQIPTCSRAGCPEPATWTIRWRNPRIHTGDRRKTWLACDAHVGYLRDFLAARDFPLEVAAGVVPDGASAEDRA